MRSGNGSPPHRKPQGHSYRGGVHTRGGLGPPLANLSLSRSDLLRHGERRTEPDLLTRLLADPGTRVLDVADGRTPVDAEARLRCARRPGDDPSAAAFLGEDVDGASYVVVGRDSPVRAGRPCATSGYSWTIGLRALWPRPSR